MGVGMAMVLGMFVVPAALVGVLVLTGTAVQRRRNELLATTGERAIGYVLAVGSDTDDLGGTSYWIKVQYPYDYQARTVQVGMSHRDQQRYRVGQRVALTYAPGRPQVVKLDPPEWALRSAS